MPETVMGRRPVPEARTREISELDLALVDALQAAPRAPWSGIGPALGVDATTARRRWERLTSRGLAWITAHDPATSVTLAYVEVTCRAGEADAVGAALARLPWVLTINETSGDHDLLLNVAAPDLLTLGRWTQRQIGTLPGVRATRTQIGIRLFGDGGDWRTRALEPAEHTRLAAHRPPRHGTSVYLPPGPTDTALIQALNQDARLSYQALGAATGVSEHTARRHLQRLVRQQTIAFRCDLARPLIGYPVAALYRVHVPFARLDATGMALSRMEPVRQCMSVSGRDNLMFVVWLHNLSGMGAFEDTLGQRFPDLEISERTVILHTSKRTGRLLDDEGRAVGHVPLSFGTVPAGSVSTAPVARGPIRGS